MESGMYSKDEIRKAVREALLEALPESGRERKFDHSVSKCPLMKQIFEAVGKNCSSAIEVDVGNNQKLNEFVKNLTKCLNDKDVVALILSNRLKFKMKVTNPKNNHRQDKGMKTAHSQVSARDHSRGNDCLESGVLTESKIMALAKTTQRIEIGKKVVLTPLARDRARAVGLEIVRQ